MLILEHNFNNYVGWVVKDFFLQVQKSSNYLSSRRDGLLWLKSRQTRLAYHVWY